MPRVVVATAPPELYSRELERYVRRVADRWPLQRAVLGGAQVDDLRGALPQRERGPEWIVVLVSDRFDGIPWLERVHVCAALWDAAEMGAPADVHCNTPLEFLRKRFALASIARVDASGIDLAVEG